MSRSLWGYDFIEPNVPAGLPRLPLPPAIIPRAVDPSLRLQVLRTQLLQLRRALLLCAGADDTQLGITRMRRLTQRLLDGVTEFNTRLDDLEARLAFAEIESIPGGAS